MIRILHSVSNMDRAGIETMLMNYYRHIDKEKIQFDFLCNKKKEGAYEEEIKKMGGRIFRTPGLNPMKFLKYKKYMKKLFKKYPEYKIIHGHNGAFAVYSLYCAKKSNIPVRIFHGHNSNLPKDLKYPLKLFCKSKLKNNITEKWGCGIEAIKFYYGSKVKCSGEYKIINNAIDVDKFSFNKDIRKKIRSEYRIENKTVIGHVGRFNVVKNHEFLIEIFKKYNEINPNSVLVLIGDGELEKQIREKIQEKNLDKAVIFVGNIENVNEWYQAFDLFILPSLMEGLPVVGIEAQAAGLPCVFSNAVPSEVDITGNSTFISLNEKPHNWSTIIENILCNYKRKDMSDKITKAGYNIKVEARKLENLYFELYESNK